MTAYTRFAAGLLALGLAACTETTPLQSGGSGMPNEQLVGSVAYAPAAPYATPGAGNDCKPWDANCTIIYNDAGGGD